MDLRLRLYPPRTGLLPESRSQVSLANLINPDDARVWPGLRKNSNNQTTFLTRVKTSCFPRLLIKNIQNIASSILDVPYVYMPSRVLSSFHIVTRLKPHICMDLPAAPHLASPRRTRIKGPRTPTSQMATVVGTCNYKQRNLAFAFKLSAVHPYASGSNGVKTQLPSWSIIITVPTSVPYPKVYSKCI